MAYDRLVKVCMGCIDYPVEVAALPAQSDIHVRSERRRDGPKRSQRVPIDGPVFQAADRLPPDASASGDVGLAEAFADAYDTQGVADADVVHGAIVAIGTSRGLTRWKGGIGRVAMMEALISDLPTVIQRTSLPGVDSCPR
jgi:hypothetical protein